MFFSTDISFKNLSMEKLSSPINNIWRVCTIVSLVSGAFLLPYLNQFIWSSSKPPETISISISSFDVIPASTTQRPSDHLAVEKNGILEDLLPIKKNLTVEGVAAIKKNETLEYQQAIKSNETLNDTLEIQRNETLKEDDGEGTGHRSGKGENDACDVFDGRWLYDPINSPAYAATDCPFLSNQVSCQKNGRPDLNYERWSWEGSHCEIPRLNRTDMLERLRGKRVVIAGDSLNRNQFESLACLLYSSIPSSDSYVDVRSGDYKIFRAQELQIKVVPNYFLSPEADYMFENNLLTISCKRYNCSVEFYWAPFLVEMEQKGQDGTRILKLDQINPSANKWKGADVMVFNTGHWWVHQGKLKAWDVIQYEGKMMENMGMEMAFERGMKTWSNWVDQNVNTSKTTVFFRSISPEHKGKDWCFHHTQPLMDESYTAIFPRSVKAIVENSIRSMRTPVKYLNITKLAEYRIDAHPKIYTTKHGLLLTDDQQKRPETYSDCSHWCIPGVPDTWNRLVYASLVFDGFGVDSTFLRRTDSSR